MSKYIIAYRLRALKEFEWKEIEINFETQQDANNKMIFLKFKHPLYLFSLHKN